MDRIEFVTLGFPPKRERFYSVHQKPHEPTTSQQRGSCLSAQGLCIAKHPPPLFRCMSSFRVGEVVVFTGDTCRLNSGRQLVTGVRGKIAGFTSEGAARVDFPGLGIVMTRKVCSRFHFLHSHVYSCVRCLITNLRFVLLRRSAQSMSRWAHQSHNRQARHTTRMFRLPQQVIRQRPEPYTT